ncbi:hypothetical protein SAMN05660860_02332 [Geoalkalibacter ferrihydriticus]|uniref:Uncharacterized protein n=2 Tax=Geoalkalibacter ferrihydriticus TaxID=392333 RepID=A0A0C2DX08_9BACT|nr:hypothetical protein [Geoalkalibacter ferrihydriticus]KIH77999.1 hypothetical protein GFER_05205 [Geoalkalibacter ferrihydriticus DSM 17813]SDM33487.1 hypothetical protein SAMN05660860_02332 [Geoalkalibacter ferrihydriticus]
MTVAELKQAVLALSREEKQELLLEILPEISQEVMQDRAFLMQLLPVFMNLVKDSGVDLQQLMQFAMMMNGGQPQR